MEYLLNYMEDYHIEELKELYTDEIINLIIEEQQNVELVIKILIDNGVRDIFNAMQNDINMFLTHYTILEEQLKTYKENRKEGQV